MNNLELNQAIVTVATAVVEASKFPSVQIEVSTEADWHYDITSIDTDFTRLGVSLDDLVVETQSVVSELQSRYGTNAERLADLALDISIKS